MTDAGIAPLATTGRVQVNPGDDITSAWGNLTFDQTMQAYDSAAARDSQWPAPADGALSYLADLGAAFVRIAGVWYPFAVLELPPPAAGAAQYYQDPALGEWWVAAAGVAAGAWRLCKGALLARVYRAAAWNVPVSGNAVALPYDSVDSDPYGLWNAAAKAFTAPIAGRYRAVAQVAATAKAAGDTLNVQARRAGAAKIWTNSGPAAAAGYLTAPAHLLEPFVAGQACDVYPWANQLLAMWTGFPQSPFTFEYVGP